MNWMGLRLTYDDYCEATGIDPISDKDWHEMAMQEIREQIEIQIKNPMGE